MSRQRSIIENFFEIGKKQPQPPPISPFQQELVGRAWGQSCIITPVSSTVGLVNNHHQIELDITPLKRFVKKMFPFVIDISYLKVGESTYTDGRRTLHNPEIKLIVSPTHRAELYSEDIEDKVKNYIRKKLIPLLVAMYEINSGSGFGLQIYFGSERSETILEHLIEE
jgi:hypothetical protein